jgi:hypothetical protein
MKFLIALFSLYILTLSCVPCSCEENCTETEISQTSTNDHQQEKDHCTPFCTCSCCQTIVTTFKISPVSPKAMEFIQAEKLFETDQRFSSYNNPPIWQPPKLSV